MARKRTSDAVEILKRRYAKTSKAKQALEQARASAEIARRLYELRGEAGLTQAELAELVGTSRTVITRLEDDDYDGHSLSMLRRVAAALDKRIEVRFVTAGKPGLSA
jgi:DNA-binding XRE family transcriptional regulator